jgi:hypothetical protein
MLEIDPSFSYKLNLSYDYCLYSNKDNINLLYILEIQ